MVYTRIANNMTNCDPADLSGFAEDFLLQAGVVNLATDLIVSANGTPNQSVNVSAGSARIQNSSWAVNQNVLKYIEAVNNGVVNLAVDPNTSGSTRIDLVCVKYDSAVTADANATNVCSLIIVKGTAGAGIPATPNNHLKLAELTLANSYTSITSGNITDKRVQTVIDASKIQGTFSTVTITNSTISTGTKLDALADPNFTFYGMARQAIINGNFDIWQRGTSFNPVDGVSVIYTADRWAYYSNANGGTWPTITLSKQTLAAGELPNSYYFLRTNVNGAGTSLGALAEYLNLQKIENGTRYLCGLNKKVTVSFYAKSSIANKKLGFYLTQSYGTGGSPTTGEIINGTNVTLTSSWTKYTQTFTTNTIIGKTFGTNNDDCLVLSLESVWGSSIQTRVGASSPETFVGSGNIDIAQVQVNAGDIALPFQPKSFNQELLDCQRYYEKSYDYSTTIGTIATNGASFAVAVNSYVPYFSIEKLKVRKRVQPSISLYSPNNGAIGTIAQYNTSDVFVSNIGAAVPDMIGEASFRWYCNNSATAGNFLRVHWTADAEL